MDKGVYIHPMFVPYILSTMKNRTQITKVNIEGQYLGHDYLHSS